MFSLELWPHAQMLTCDFSSPATHSVTASKLFSCFAFVIFVWEKREIKIVKLPKTGSQNTLGGGEIFFSILLEKEADMTQKNLFSNSSSTPRRCLRRKIGRFSEKSTSWIPFKQKCCVHSTWRTKSTDFSWENQNEENHENLIINTSSDFITNVNHSCQGSAPCCLPWGKFKKNFFSEKQWSLKQIGYSWCDHDCYLLWKLRPTCLAKDEPKFVNLSLRCQAPPFSTKIATENQEMTNCVFRNHCITSGGQVLFVQN